MTKYRVTLYLTVKKTDEKLLPKIVREVQEAGFLAKDSEVFVERLRADGDGTDITDEITSQIL